MHFFLNAFACLCLLGNGNGEKASDHWAFQTVSDPEPPRVRDQSWIRNGIDSFILAKLESKGIPTPDRASKSILERRLSFALVGLPPSTLDPQDSFLEQVEALLVSPHYGERWGRHWLDVVRYADSNGLDENAAHANAWRYRDYVVRSFNEDKPFDRFITEQVAGDLLPDNGDFSVRRNNLVATGFLALGPKLLAEPDLVKLEMDMIDEQIDVLGRAFLGLTLGCARCHEHKFDPVSTEEYYALAGIFKSTRTMESLKRPAKWVENLLANSEEQKLSKKHQDLVEAQNAVVVAYRERANQELLASGKFSKLPKNPEAHYPEPTRKELENLEKTLKLFNESSPKLDFAMGVQEGNVTELPVFVGGDPEVHGEIQPRGFPALISIPEARVPDYGGSGRLELAAWLTSSRNPLTARVIVNRLWHHHFGRGIVESVNDFGFQGSKPTHPALLDYLAHDLIENGWTLKRLHKKIMMTAAYQMGSTESEANNTLDPSNSYWWKRSPRRLEAEVLRDNALAVSGMIDRRMYGAGTLDQGMKRRSIYFSVKRSKLIPMMQLFDWPDTMTSQGRRAITTTPSQALVFINSPQIREMAAHFAKIVLGSSDPVGSAVYRAHGALPSPERRAQLKKFLRKQTASYGGREEPAMIDLCHALLASNEMIYVE